MTLADATTLLEFAAVRRAADYSVSNFRHNVAWLIKNETWVSVRWCRVSIYSEGCFRFGNHHHPRIPKRVWPFELPSYDEIGKMEVTVHESELNDALLKQLVLIAENPKGDYRSPLFENGLIKPSYCWSIKANKHYNKKRAKKA